MEWPTLWGEAVDQVPINNLIPTLNEQLFLCQPLADYTSSWTVSVSRPLAHQPATSACKSNFRYQLSRKQTAPSAGID